MDKEFLAEARQKRETEIPMQAVANECGRSTPAHLLNCRAKELRDEAYRLETLARELEHMPFSNSAADTLGSALGRALFR